MASKLVLGIDPGLTRCGFGLVAAETVRNLKLVGSGVIRSESTIALQKRIALVGSELEKLIIQHRPGLIALEQVFSQANVSTVMAVAQISGVVMFLAEKNQIPVQLFTPTEVKSKVTGYGKADKQQVRAMVLRQLSLSELQGPADESDALALAICGHRSLVSNFPSSSANSNSDKSSSTLTPAQQLWLAAERRQKNKG